LTFPHAKKSKVTTMDKSNLTDLERDLVEGMEGFLHDLKDGSGSIGGKYTCRRVVLDLAPKAYGAAEVKSTRQLLNTSQALFAAFLGVSPKTVKAWEQNTRVPGDMACRFMDEVQRNPEYFRERFSKLAQVKC